MTAAERHEPPRGAGTLRAKPALLAGLIVAAGVLLLAFANTHLVYVAVTSQPECVAHLKGGERASGSGLFSAAKPAC